ncbi:MAG: Gldg family protein [Planctomycetes bacterium]|nr:Gldg family protein [Planctomycetota bacterium]
MVVNARTVNLAVYLGAVVTIAVVVNVLAAHPRLRWQADATKTRAYSLSPQTKKLLAGLDGEWLIAVVMGDEGVDRALLRQVEQVLDRYRKASERISVVRIDPADPASLDTYEALLTRLRNSYREPIAEYDAALADGRDALQGFRVFLQRQTGGLVTLGKGIDPGDVARPEIDQLVAVISLRLEQARQVEIELDRAVTTGDSRPLPDYETARSVLAVALTTWGDEIYQIVELLNEWRDNPATNLAVRRYGAAHREDFQGWAEELAARADPLKHLPPLELARIGRSLEAGETAIVFGPHGAAVVPSEQLFARVNLRSRGSGAVTFDQRFRGEQAISAAIRVLQGDVEMPLCMLVHAQDESLLSRRAQNIDFVGSAEILRATRVEVREWLVTRSGKPTPPRDRAVVWVVVPPPIPQRTSLAVTDAERKLIDAVRGLIADGEPVLLSLAPSGMSRTGQRDPWRNLAAPFGLSVDTGRVVIEAVRTAQGEAGAQRVIQLSDYSDGHAIGSAVHGLQTSFDLPIAIGLADPSGAVFGDVRQSVIAFVAPSPTRWLEPDWMVSPSSLDEPDAEQRFSEPLPLVVAVVRRNPVESGSQRFLLVGSGGWMLSYLADVVVPVGGDRMVLVNPGNYELLMAGISWLGGADDLILSSPVSRQVARLEGLTPSVLALWRWIALAIMPGACLGLGIAVWFVRRS